MVLDFLREKFGKEKPIYDGVPSEYLDQYHSYFDLDSLKKKYRQRQNGFKMLYAREHPVSFAWFMLGKKLRPYQSYAIDQILNNQKSALCWARRLGKSTVIAILAFWMTYFNKFPKNSMENFTVIGLVSKENDAAKKLLQAVKQLIYDGDARYYQITKNKPHETKDFFSSKLIEPTNAEQITWWNRSVIKSLPPTKKVKGWGFSHLFIDEIAYLDPKEEDVYSFFSLTCMPTLADCAGKLTIASTPAGRTGLFYDLFDPDGEKGSDFLRLWFNWKINNDEDNYRVMVESEQLNLTRMGRENFFKQEFLADFTVTQSSFFDLEDVELYFNPDLPSEYTWHKTPCSVGIDFGISECATVITVKTQYLNKIRLLYQRKFPIGFDNNELTNPNNDDSIQNLFKRYNVQWLVPEESSVSDMFVKWCKRKGYPVFSYRFSGGNLGSKNTAFHTFRSMLKQGKLESYPLDDLKREMISLQEEREKINWIISKPSGGSDDCVDSDVFATIPFFEDEGSGWHGIIDMEAKLKEKAESDGSTKFDISGKNLRHDPGVKSVKQKESGFWLTAVPFKR